MSEGIKKLFFREVRKTLPTLGAMAGKTFGYELREWTGEEERGAEDARAQAGDSHARLMLFLLAHFVEIIELPERIIGKRQWSKSIPLAERAKILSELPAGDLFVLWTDLRVSTLGDVSRQDFVCGNPKCAETTEIQCDLREAFTFPVPSSPEEAKINYKLSFPVLFGKDSDGNERYITDVALTFSTMKSAFDAKRNVTSETTRRLILETIVESNIGPGHLPEIFFNRMKKIDIERIIAEADKVSSYPDFGVEWTCPHCQTENRDQVLTYYTFFFSAASSTF